MTKEKLLARKAELQAQQEQLKANFNAFQGAIQECDHWLQQLAEGADEKKPE